jgi:2-polyprenyl-3-methyl-5-hydroxy-6-metoxy-1,4-benzoquinol methylase
VQQLIKQSVRRLLPEWMKKQIRYYRNYLMLKQTQGFEYDLGMYILSKAKDFSRRRGGMPDALQASQLMDCILRQTCLTHINEAHQYLQTAFMPHYEQNLYEYYRQQQYLILLTFLSYAFRGSGCLFSHIQPFLTASAKLPTMRILDYGAGLPFGIIHLLRTCPEKIESITIVDMDLVHTEFAEFILSDLCPDTRINFIKVTDPAKVPDFQDRTFNIIYGKDIFEHLHHPERYLRAILDGAEDICYCYFDFTDHGERWLQHVNPDLSHLQTITRDYFFKAIGKIGNLSEFVRAV